jgi:hypothetical protein
MFPTQLAVGDKTGTGVSASHRLRFRFLTPPDPNRAYLARIHVDGRYARTRADFYCVTVHEPRQSGRSPFELGWIEIAHELDRSEPHSEPGIVLRRSCPCDCGSANHLG